MYRKIYAVYDRSGTLVFTGVAKECAEFIGCKYRTFLSATYVGSVIGGKYTAVYLWKERVTKRTCTHCHQTFPAEQMYQRQRKDGTYFPSNVCYECYIKYLKERRKKK